MSAATLGIVIILVGIALGAYTMHQSENFRSLVRAFWESTVLIVKPLIHKTWFRAIAAGGLILLGGWLAISSLVGG